MRTQLALALFAPDLPPIARATDPETSHVAASEHTNNGRRAAHAERILAVVRAHPGWTYREIARLVPELEAVEVQRRLADLADLGRVVRGEARACKVSGRPAQTWGAK